MEAARASGDVATARELLEEAVEEQRQRGMKAGAARDLLELERLLDAKDAQVAAASRAREAAELLAESGDASAVAVLRRALERDPADPEGLLRLAAVEARFDPAAAEATLRRALAEQPDDPAIEAALLRLLEQEGREGSRARILLDRARRQPGAAARAGLRREAARLLDATGLADDRSLAADALVAVTTDLPGDAGAQREAAAALVACGRSPEAIPLLAALLRTNPGDAALAAQLERAGGEHPWPAAELAAESIEEAFTSPEPVAEPLHGPRFDPMIGPTTLEFPAPDRGEGEPLPAELEEAEPGTDEPEREPAGAPIVAGPYEPLVGPRTLEFPAVLRLTDEVPAIELPAEEEPPGEPHLPSTTLEFEAPRRTTLELPVGEAFAEPAPAATPEELEPPAEEPPEAAPAAAAPAEPTAAQAREEAGRLAALAESARDPSARATAWLGSARAAQQAGAAVEEVRLGPRAGPRGRAGRARAVGGARRAGAGAGRPHGGGPCPPGGVDPYRGSVRLPTRR